MPTLVLFRFLPIIFLQNKTKNMTNLLAKISNWKLIIPALLGFIYCIYLFQNAEAQMSELAGVPTQMIDMRKDYDVAEIQAFFTSIQAEGRETHRFATGVVDMIFPWAYGILFILIAAFFLKKLTSPDSKWMYLSLFPVLLMIVDYIENFNTLDLLDSYPNLTAEMVSSASTVTGIKSTLTSMSIFLPLFLGIFWLIIWTKKRFDK